LGNVLHDPVPRLENIDECQEALDQGQTLGWVTIAAPIAEREECAGRGAYEDVYLGKAVGVQIQDILTADIDFGMVLLVGIDGGLPVVDTPEDFVTGLTEALRKPACSAEQVPDRHRCGGLNSRAFPIHTRLRRDHRFSGYKYIA